MRKVKMTRGWGGGRKEAEIRTKAALREFPFQVQGSAHEGKGPLWPQGGDSTCNHHQGPEVRQRLASILVSHSPPRPISKPHFPWIQIKQSVSISRGGFPGDLRTPSRKDVSLKIRRAHFQKKTAKASILAFLPDVNAIRDVSKISPV